MDTVTHGGSETWHLLGPFAWVSASIPSSHAFHLVCPQGPCPALNVAWLAVFPLPLLAIKFPWVSKLTVYFLSSPALGGGRWQLISWMHMYCSSWSRMVAWYLESLAVIHHTQDWTSKFWFLAESSLSYPCIWDIVPYTACLCLVEVSLQCGRGSYPSNNLYLRKRSIVNASSLPPLLSCHHVPASLFWISLNLW